jgi:hypothetical protein
VEQSGSQGEIVLQSPTNQVQVRITRGSTNFIQEFLDWDILKVRIGDIMLTV